MRITNPFKCLSQTIVLLFTFLLLFHLHLLAQVKSNNVDTILKRAQPAFAKNPQAGIAMAKQAYLLSSKNGSPQKVIKSLYLLTYLHWDIQDFKNAAQYAQNGLKVAKENHIDSSAGDFSVLNGAIDHIENNYQQAIIWYQAALPYYEKNKLRKRIGNTYVDIGICEIKLSRYELANINLLKAADIFQALKDTVDLSAAYNSIGACFNLSHNDEKAIKYYRDALILRRQLKDNGLIAQSLNNLGFAFSKNKNPDSAIFYLSKCLVMNRHLKDTSTLAITLQNLGAAWKSKNNLKKAEAYNLRSVLIAGNYNMKEDLAKGYLALADIYALQKKYHLALTNINKSEANAKGLHIPDLLIDTYTSKFNLFSQMGDYKNALLYNIKKDSLKDSIFTITKNKAVDELETKYRTSQKEKNIALLRVQNNMEAKSLSQQKQFNFILVIAATLLLVLFIIAYSNFRIKNNANQRIQILMRELHHRIKNNLQILAGLFSLQIESLTDENTKSALRENESRLTSMNLVHNKLYVDNTTTQIEMEEYLTKLLHHIKNSFGGDKKNGVNLRIEVDPIMLDADKAVAIGLIVNELATNAFKYAFDGRVGEIFIGLKQAGKSKLLLTLKDNGKGIADVHKENGVSFGLKLVNLMIRQLHSTMSLSNDNGTSYQITINI